MTLPAPNCSDVLRIFNKAREAVGDQAALDVIHRLGARYAATIAPKDYEIAIGALTELIQHSRAGAADAAEHKAAA